MKKIIITIAVFCLLIVGGSLTSCKKNNIKPEGQYINTAVKEQKIQDCDWKTVDYYEYTYSPTTCYHVTGQVCIDRYDHITIRMNETTFTPVYCFDIPIISDEPFSFEFQPNDYYLLEILENPYNPEYYIITVTDGELPESSIFTTLFANLIGHILNL
ncbi:MAG: hypothetical protein KBA86_05875 [Bacteroidales bacterium]|nr:hypothetical protein [Bacteroidales bacterium]